MSSAGMEPRGEYAKADKIMIGLVYSNEIASNFYRNLFQDLETVLPKD